MIIYIACMFAAICLMSLLGNWIIKHENSEHLRRQQSDVFNGDRNQQSDSEPYGTATEHQSIESRWDDN